MVIVVNQIRSGLEILAYRDAEVGFDGVDVDKLIDQLTLVDCIGDLWKVSHFIIK